MIDNIGCPECSNILTLTIVEYTEYELDTSLSKKSSPTKYQEYSLVCQKCGFNKTFSNVKLISEAVEAQKFKILN